MFKKRDLPLLVLIGLLFIIGAIVPMKRALDEHSPLVEVCRNHLLSAGFRSPTGYSVYTCGSKEFHMPVKYQYTRFSSSDTATVYFNDGVNDMWCHMQLHGSKWVVTGGGTTIVGMCP